MADGSRPKMDTRSRPASLVMQNEAAECALACLVMVANSHGHNIDLAGLRRRFSTSLRGIDLGGMIAIAQGLGFEARPLRAELEYLPESELPCILHWDLNHFVVLRRVTRRGLEILDPARGQYSMTLAEASAHFTGIVIELQPGADFAPVQDRQPVSLRALTGRISGVLPTFIQILGLALAIEVLGLLLPFQGQWVVDQVVVASDTGLLAIVTCAFVIVMLLQTALSIARAWVLTWLSATVTTQWVTNLFTHLTRLPLDFFEKRHMGDVLSRFSSLQSIQNTLTGSFAEALLDRLTGTLALVILAVYSIALTGLVMATVAIYGAMRWTMYRALWRANEEQLAYTARQQTELMESVRGMQTIKVGGKEGVRRTRLSNATVEAAKRSMRSQRITLTFGAVNRGIFGLQRVVLIAVTALMAIRGHFTVGMLFAFVAYADQLSMKAGGLVDKAVDFKMLRLHAARVGDIALAVPESRPAVRHSDSPPDAGITLRNVSFRYSVADPWLFRNLSLSVGAGESVAIIGPSGCGKSTLAKLILGLLAPGEGAIEIGGLDIQAFGIDAYRGMLGVVMQDDHLFAGSIADNIAFFDEGADFERVKEAARNAAVHEEIASMPMGYETLVGDMGSSLSGGQKQRILLARALYRRPLILILDEATSHLDVQNEKLANETIKRLNVTRIVIAHRPETINSADRVINLGPSENT